jgi:hypothetical protein
MKKMSPAQQKQLLDYADKATKAAFDKITVMGNIKARLDKFYARIGKEVIEGMKKDFDTEFNLLVSGKSTLKDIL